jgi:hypothetical protein
LVKAGKYLLRGVCDVVAGYNAAILQTRKLGNNRLGEGTSVVYVALAMPAAVVHRSKKPIPAKRRQFGTGVSDH